MPKSIEYFPNILFSYAYYNTDRHVELIKMLSKCTKILLDSGGFTAHFSKRKILAGKNATEFDVTLPKVIDFYKKLDGHVWNYIQLDVVKRQEETRENLYRMLDAGLKPMPVWLENDEDLELLDQLLDINKYVCIAGGGRTNNDWYLARIKQVYEHSNKKAKLHALAFSQHPESYFYALNSCDSSTFTYAKRSLQLFEYNIYEGFTSVKVRNSKRQNKLKSILSKYDLLDIESHDLHGNYNVIYPITLSAFLRFGANMEARGKHYFFSISNYHDLYLILIAYSLMDENFHLSAREYRNMAFQLKRDISEDFKIAKYMIERIQKKEFVV